MRSHEWIERRSLGLHQAVADKLAADPALLELARANLERWSARGGCAALREWKRILATVSLPDLLALLRSPSEEAARLRQSSPFAGVLTPAERQAILDRYELVSA